MTEKTASQTDERVLRQSVEQIVADRFGTPALIVSVQRKPSAYIASYDCDLITVELSTGQALRLFRKDYRVSHKSKDQPELRREREMRVYRDLLSKADLGPPAYYGSVWDAAADRFWVFLEFVDGLVVQHHDADYVLLAAEWLAAMQGFFIKRREMLNACSPLIQQDGAFFRSKAEKALWDVTRVSPSSAGHLTEVVEAYKRTIDVLGAQPRSLVHGGYVPWHILVDPRPRPARVCAVDWELAGLGPTLYDLAYFTYDIEPQSQDRVLDAYRRAAIRHQVPTPAGVALKFVVACLYVHRVLDWLSRSIEKRYSESKVAKLVDRADELTRSMLSLA